MTKYAIMSVEEFLVWFRKAERGKRRCYYRGHLAFDRGDNRDTRTAEQLEIHRLANAALSLAAKNAAALTQKKCGPTAFEYFITKR